MCECENLAMAHSTGQYSWEDCRCVCDRGRLSPCGSPLSLLLAQVQKQSNVVSEERVHCSIVYPRCDQEILMLLHFTLSLISVVSVCSIKGSPFMNPPSSVQMKTALVMRT